MPSGKQRSKDDTWTPDELSKAMKGSRDDFDKKRHRHDADDRHRHRDLEEGKERQRHRDELNGQEEKRRGHYGEEKKLNQKDTTNNRRRRHDISPEPEVHITEEERERQRKERRERREQKEGKTDDKRKPKKEERQQIIDDNGDYERRKHRDRRNDKLKLADDDEYRKRRNHDHTRHLENEAERGDRHRRDSKHRKENGVEEKRDRQKDEQRDRNKHRDRERDERKDKHRNRERDERRDRDKHRDRERVERRDRDKHRDRERDDRKEQDKHREGAKDGQKEQDKHRDEEREKYKNRDKDGSFESRKQYSEQEASAERKEADSEPDEEEPYYEDDFEDYEDDFEDDEDDIEKKDGEMDEVLKALDDENTRLLAESHRSNWSDSTELSDERFKEVPSKATRGMSFINFVSAKERVLTHKMASKTRKRAEDLASMVELDFVQYDMFDLPPVREYELYIRSFGRSNTKQVYIQTNEDNIDHEIQTEQVDTKDKWTQSPPEDVVDCGGDDIEDARKDFSSGKFIEISRLAKFLERTSQTIGILLEEELESQKDTDLHNTESNFKLSVGYSQLRVNKFLKGRHVVCASFCVSQPDMLLTLHSMPKKDGTETAQSHYGLLCVWNVAEPSTPQKILGCNSQPICCCFSPSKATLAFSGMTDGSVVVWDLREAASMHLSVSSECGPVRFPTFNTAGIADSDNHHSPVNCIVPIFSVLTSTHKKEDINDSNAGLSFQLASLEENGVVYLWVVAEIANPDSAGSVHDLGLAPGGRIKLLKSSSITLENPRKEIRVKTNLHTKELHLLPSDLNHFYVTTDCGFIIHGIRFGSRVFPRTYSPVIETPVTVTSIDISPFVTSYIVAGCDDGSLHMYHTKSQNPLVSLHEFSHGQPILCVRWSRSRPAVFYVLDDNSTIHVFDILEHSSIPVQSNHITSGRVITISLSNDPKITGLGTVSRPPQLLLSLDNGVTEIHTIKKDLSEPQTLEEEFLEKYVDMF